MKVVLKLEGLDCANCAAKIETAVSKIKGVEDVNVVFMTQKLSFTTEREDVDALVEQITKEAMKASGDVKSVKRIK
ncbi:MAG: cation transporter [Candidatus Methanomethylophilaceae archaeon]|nr:cation transporter [Candidatus Methanomethylophilaceae archaeon]